MREHATGPGSPTLHHQEETVTQSSPTPPLDIERFARASNYQSWLTDWAISALEDRVVRIEELIAARWWQRPGVRRKLARELRASVAGYGDWMPRDFATRRVQYAGEVWIPQVTRARNAGSEDAL
jgi:hypothetical protein